MLHATREALAAFWRTPLLVGLSLAMMALALFVVGVFALSVHNIQLVLDRVEEQVEVVVYLRDDAPADEIRQAQAEIESRPEVLEVRYISREQALDIAQRELEEFRGIFADLDVNPLPASLEVALQPGYRDPDAVSDVADEAATFPVVEDVRFGQEWLEKIYLLGRIAGAATGVLGVAFVVAAVLIIGGAVRMAIFARRDEIAIMRLVGATDGYVWRPFVLEGVIAGFLGSVAALGLVYGVHHLLSGAVVQLEWLPIRWVIIGLCAGTLLGASASSIAVQRHLRGV